MMKLSTKILIAAIAVVGQGASAQYRPMIGARQMPTSRRSSGSSASKEAKEKITQAHNTRMMMVQNSAKQKQQEFEAAHQEGLKKVVLGIDWEIREV